MRPSFIKNVSVKSLMHKMSYQEAVEAFGAKAIVDSSFFRKKGFVEEGKITFAPVYVDGFPAIVQASFSSDSTTRFDLFLPYTPRKNVKPTEPYGQHRFVKATLDDFDRFKAAVTQEIGDPSVGTETTFEYMIYGDGGTMQPIFASLIKGVINVQVLPMVRPAENKVR